MLPPAPVKSSPGSRARERRQSPSALRPSTLLPVCRAGQGSGPYPHLGPRSAAAAAARLLPAPGRRGHSPASGPAGLRSFRICSGRGLRWGFLLLRALSLPQPRGWTTPRRRQGSIHIRGGLRGQTGAYGEKGHGEAGELRDDARPWPGGIRSRRPWDEVAARGSPWCPPPCPATSSVLTGSLAFVSGRGQGTGLA